MSRVPNPTTIDGIIEKINERTIKDPTTLCWLWQGSLTKDGYGNIKFGDKIHRIHRLSAHKYLGLDLKDRDKHALHEVYCPNRNCWNPHHLYIGTNYENTQDSKRAGTNFQRTRTHCPHGHLLDGMNKHGWRYCKTCNNLRNK